MKKVLCKTTICAGLLLSANVNALEAVSSGGESSEIGIDVGLTLMRSTLENQTKKLEQYIANVKVCNKKSMLFAPGHAQADADSCIFPTETDGSAFNYAFEPDLDNNADAAQGRPSDLGMEVCAEGEFVTANGKTDVQCKEIGGAVVKPGDSCPAQTTYLGDHAQQVPEMVNGETMSFEYEACDSANSAATLFTQDVTCMNGILIKDENVQNCSWKKSSDKCEFVPSQSCKPTVGENCPASTHDFSYKFKSHSFSCKATAGEIANGVKEYVSCQAQYNSTLNDEPVLYQYKECKNGTLINATSVGIIGDAECGTEINTCKHGSYGEMKNTESEVKWWCFDNITTDDAICSAKLEDSKCPSMRNVKNPISCENGTGNSYYSLPVGSEGDVEFVPNPSGKKNCDQVSYTCKAGTWTKKTVKYEPTPEDLGSCEIRHPIGWYGASNPKDGTPYCVEYFRSGNSTAPIETSVLANGASNRASSGYCGNVGGNMKGCYGDISYKCDNGKMVVTSSLCRFGARP